MYNNGVELGHLAVFISSNWWTIFAVFAIINLVKFLWSDQGKSGQKKLDRASALARAELDLKREVELKYDDDIRGVVVFEEESALLRDKALCPDARGVEQEVKSWRRFQDALSKKQDKKEEEEREDKEFPQFHRKCRSGRNNRPNRPRSNRPRPQQSEKAVEIWLPGGQIKRV